MKSTEFCYWLQGFFELSNDVTMTPDQVRMVRNHLNLVFKHEIDPSYGMDPAEAQVVHDGKPEKPERPRPQFGGVGPGGTLLRC